MELITQEEKKHSRRNTLLVLALALILAFPTIPYLLYRFAVNYHPQTTKDTVFEIKSGQGVSEIAGNLKDAGLIDSPLVFRIYAKISGQDKNLQAGVYEVPKKTSIVELASIFQNGKNDITVRFIEGWRMEELAEYLQYTIKDFDKEKFLSLAKGNEGKLFPDTYLVKSDASEQDVFDLLSTTFETKTEDLITKDRLAKVGLTENEALTLASIIEREAAKQEDRKLIAGILIKRFVEGMKIEADATTQYAVALPKFCLPNNCLDADTACQITSEQKLCLDGQGLGGVDWWPHNLTLNDLNYDSPYNTRKYVGLPPTPISSFSLDALDSVINHQTSEYYFYLTDSKGVTHFAKTLDEHVANINTYLNQ